MYHAITSLLSHEPKHLRYHCRWKILRQDVSPHHCFREKMPHFIIIHIHEIKCLTSILFHNLTVKTCTEDFYSTIILSSCVLRFNFLRDQVLLSLVNFSTFNIFKKSIVVNFLVILYKFFLYKIKENNSSEDKNLINCVHQK